jgi:hypothetical protein
MTRETLSWWGICVSIAAGTVVAGGCSGSSGSGGDHGPVLGGPGQTDPAAGRAPAATPGSTLFAVTYGNTNVETLGGLAADAAGNFYVGGFESAPPTSTGQSATDLFILKYSSAGVLLWKQPIPFDISNPLSLEGLVVQPTTGAVIVAGSFNGTAAIEGKTMTSGTQPLSPGATVASPATNVFLAAYDSAGYFLWSRSFASNASVSVNQVFAAANGDIELMGVGDNNAMVGGGPLCCRAGEFNGPITYVARYSPAGDPIWSNAIGGEFFSDLLGADADADGGMVVGGAVHGTLTYQGESFSGGGSQPDGSSVDVGAVLRIDGQGRKRWIKVYPAAGAHTRLGAGLDAAENVILYGNFADTFDLGNGVSLTATAGDGLSFAQPALLAKLDPSGTALWAQQFPASGPDEVFPDVVATDADGNIALAGETSGSLGVGGPALLPPDTRGEFVAKYSPDGSFLWSRGFPIEHGFASASRRHLSFDPQGELGFAGSFHNTVDFGTGPITVPGERREARGGAPLPPDDLFLLKLAP